MKIHGFRRIKAKVKKKSSYQIIIQSFHQHEDKSLALWALFIFLKNFEELLKWKDVVISISKVKEAPGSRYCPISYTKIRKGLGGSEARVGAS